MKKKDEGAIHKLLAMIILMWAVLCWNVLLEVMRAGYVNRYLEDCITQANLAALLIDPYYYGATGELVFDNVEETKAVFSEFIEKGLGSEETRQKLGIMGEVQILDFRVYEVTSIGITEFVYNASKVCSQTLYDKAVAVTAPDGTDIQNSSIYARIAVPIEFLFGVEIMAEKEHCVDMVSEEIVYE